MRSQRHGTRNGCLTRAPHFAGQQRNSRHIENIAQMAQENSSAAEQNRASAHTFRKLATSLRGSMMKFGVWRGAAALCRSEVNERLDDQRPVKKPGAEYRDDQ
jgi:hypothetical protein